MNFINKDSTPYILGLEHQFCTLVRTFFDKVVYFSDLGIEMQFAFAVLDNDNLYFYNSKYTKAHC